MGNISHVKEYIKNSFLWQIYMFPWFGFLLLKNMKNITDVVVKVVFIIGVFVIITCVTGAVICDKRDKNKMIMEDIVIIWGIYLSAELYDMYSERVKAVAVIAVISAVIMTSLIMFRKIDEIDRKKLIINRRIKNVVVVWRRTAAIAAILLLSSFAVSGVKKEFLTETLRIYDEECSFESNIDVIADIYPDRWRFLNIQEKLECMQAVIDSQGYKKGLNYEIIVDTQAFNESTLGCYDNQEHKIYLNSRYVNELDSYEMLDVILHECMHAYQHEQVEMYNSLDEHAKKLEMFKDIAIYDEEFQNYVEMNEDAAGYYHQKSEINAREMAKSELEYYVSVIEEYAANN